MRTVALALLAPLALIGCVAADELQPLPAAGEACDEESRCAEGLGCVRLICVDNEGPKLYLSSPMHLEVHSGEVTSLWVYLSVSDSVAGDQVEVTVDPDTPDQHRELLAFADKGINTQLQLPAPLAVGPHHLRARIVDGDERPYPNPSASDEVVMFVRDPDISTTPQLAVVWPPRNHQHRIGTPLEVEVAVLPGSFTFVQTGVDCSPLPNCEPAFAPECEAECGPVSRMGHAKLFMLPDYPDCLLDEPIGCNGSYIMSMRPGDGVEVIDGHQLRVVLPPKYLVEPGKIPLHAALSYDYHDPYPSKASVVHDSLMLTLIE